MLHDAYGTAPCAQRPPIYGDWRARCSVYPWFAAAKELMVQRAEEAAEVRVVTHAAAVTMRVGVVVLWFAVPQCAPVC